MKNSSKLFSRGTFDGSFCEEISSVDFDDFFLTGDNFSASYNSTNWMSSWDATNLGNEFDSLTYSFKIKDLVKFIVGAATIFKDYLLLLDVVSTLG